MSGHSRWHTIKHKKAALDAKRGKLFTKVIKELTIAARMGGSDPNSNPRLRTAIQAAKDVNMPKDTMDRAIKKGAGELEGQSYEEITYEGYGPGGVAIMARTTTDNRNRSVSEIKFMFSKNGGNLGTSGCVGYLFSKVGNIMVEDATEDQLMEAALEAGAENVQGEDGTFIVRTAPENVQEVRDALEAKKFKVTSSGVNSVPATTVRLEGKEALACAKLINALEDHDDVDEVAHNLEATEEVMQAMS